MSATIEPVTTSGWYERRDGSIGEYKWIDGQVKMVRSVASWKEQAALRNAEVDRIENEMREQEIAEYNANLAALAEKRRHDGQ